MYLQIMMGALFWANVLFLEWSFAQTWFY